MTILLVAILSLCLASVFRWRLMSRLALLFILLYMFGLGSGFVPTMMLKHLEIYNPLESVAWKERNVIIVLGAGLEEGPESHILHTSPFGYSRLMEGAHQYRQCKEHGTQCHILLSGGDPGHHSVAEAEVMAKELTQIGIPKDDLVLEDKSRNTFQNARYSRALVEQINPEQLVLVTSGFHMRRSMMYFAHFTMHPQPAPSDQWNAAFTWWPVTYNFSMTDLALHEYLGMAQFYLYEFMGWNKV